MITTDERSACLLPDIIEFVTTGFHRVGCVGDHYVG